jgi:hypothetical protein
MTWCKLAFEFAVVFIRHDKTGDDVIYFHSKSSHVDLLCFVPKLHDLILSLPDLLGR